MAFNGLGTFARLYSWVTDLSNSININATRMDAEMDGFATGLSNCITKDGQTTITANLPMAGFRHTGVGTASARNHYGVVSQIQDEAYIWGGTGGGTANAITLTLSPAPTAYTAGMRIRFIASGANSSTVTINVNTLGAKDIRKGGTTALAAGNIQSGQVVDISYDGTYFQMTNDVLVATSNAIIAGNGSSPVRTTGVTIDTNDNLYAFGGLVEDVSGTTYTLDAADKGKIKRFTSGSSVTITLPSTLVAGFSVCWIQDGAGQLTFTAGSGATLQNRQGHSKSAGQYGAGSLIVVANSGGSAAAYRLAGDTGV